MFLQCLFNIEATIYVAMLQFNISVILIKYLCYVEYL